jgi:Domain of unknown function (DUF6946)/Family of unknown function (DUF6308)
VSGAAIGIERLDGGRLELDGWGLASLFFTTDPSSVGIGAYDALCGRTASNMIEVSDVEALNRTMRARTAHRRWAPLLNQQLRWLGAIDPTLDLIETPDRGWVAADAERLVLEALRSTVDKGRGVSVATKMLHLKRPRLFPILDRLVAELLGAALPEEGPPELRARPAAELVFHLRAQGRANIDALRDIQAGLARLGHERSLVRILDAILWLSHPAAGNVGSRRLLECRMDGLASWRLPRHVERDLFLCEGDVRVLSPDLVRTIRSVADWFRLAPPAGGVGQWKDGRSAKEAAKAWFRDGTPKVPVELADLFETRKLTRGLVVCSVVPERVTFFADGVFGPRHHDLALYGHAGPHRTVVGIEVKADESLDRTVGQRVKAALRDRAAGKKTLFPERMAAFAHALFGWEGIDEDGNVEPRLTEIPYQLLSGVAGTIREAALHEAHQAVFAVHVLDSGRLDQRRLKANEQGLSRFCELLGLEPTGLGERRLLGPVDYPGSKDIPVLPLVLGLTVGHL